MGVDKPLPTNEVTRTEEAKEKIAEMSALENIVDPSSNKQVQSMKNNDVSTSSTQIQNVQQTQLQEKQLIDK